LQEAVVYKRRQARTYINGHRRHALQKMPRSPLLAVYTFNQEIKMKLFFDTETTGVPANYNAPVSDSANWPRLVQIGYIVMDGDKVVHQHEAIIKPVGFEIPIGASNVHGISTERAIAEGQDLDDVIDEFVSWASEAKAIVGHNVSFDIHIVGAEFWRLHGFDPFVGKKTIDTMKSSTEFCQLPGGYGGKYKWPKLAELYRKLFDADMGAAHTALQDIENTAACYFELVKRGVITE